MDAEHRHVVGLNVKLHLGVYQVPEPESAWDSYDVAKHLEEKYHLFSKFAENHIEDISKHLTEGIKGALETMMLGQQVQDPFAAGTDQIDKDFRHFLDIEEMAKLGVPGVPTKAALKGASKRFKRRKGPRRPSFIDSGTLQSSFKSWVEE